MRDVESNFTKKYNQMVRIQFLKKKNLSPTTKIYFYITIFRLNGFTSSVSE